jgi:hypothetical protein
VTLQPKPDAGLVLQISFKLRLRVCHLGDGWLIGSTHQGIGGHFDGFEMWCGNAGLVEKVDFRRFHGAFNWILSSLSSMDLFYPADISSWVGCPPLPDASRMAYLATPGRILDSEGRNFPGRAKPRCATVAPDGSSYRIVLAKELFLPVDVQLTRERSGMGYWLVQFWRSR